MIIKPPKEVCVIVEDLSFPKLIDLLWDDILISHLLPILSLKELFILRGLSRKYKLLIDTYFCQMKVINLARHRHKFTDVAFQVLSARCTQLRSFIAPKCQFLTDDLVIPLFEKNPCIKMILLNQCERLTSVCLQPIIINCKGLRFLGVAGCSWLTVGCLESIQLHQQQLTDINFNSCLIVNNPGVINKFFTFEQELENLSLKNLDCINDSTLLVLAKCAKKLKTVNLTGCKEVTDYGLCMLVEHCRNLKSITCIGCTNLSDWTTRACLQRNITLFPQPSRMVRMLWPPQPRIHRLNV